MNTTSMSDFAKAMAAMGACLYACGQPAAAQQCSPVEIAVLHGDAWEADRSEYDKFGYTSDIFGDTIVTSCWHEYASNPTVHGEFGEGAVYFFKRTKSGWEFQQKYFDTLTSYVMTFGFSAAIHGNTAVLGSYYGFPVQVVTENNGVWELQQQIASTEQNPDSYFGISVDIWDDTLAIGDMHNSSTATNAGKVFVYTRSGSTWSLQQALELQNPVVGARFGMRVELRDDVLVAHSITNQTRNIHIFERTGTTWTEGVNLSDILGRSMWAHAVTSDRIIVGDSADDEVAQNAGAAFVFKRTGGTWQLETKLAPQELQEDDFFGWHVEIEDETILVNARGVDNAPGQPTGKVFVYRYLCDQWKLVDRLTISGSSLDRYRLQMHLHGTTAVTGTVAFDGFNQLGQLNVLELDCPTVCPADIDDAQGSQQPDGVVDVFDLLLLLASWNTNGPGANIAEPLDVVDVFDLLQLLAVWSQ